MANSIKTFNSPKLTELIGQCDEECESFGGRVVALLYVADNKFFMAANPSLSEAQQEILIQELLPAFARGCERSLGLQGRKSKPS